MLVGLLILAAAALSAPIPGGTVTNNKEERTTNLDINEINETNFVSKFILSLKNLMNYFNEKLPEGDLTNLKCEIVTKKKEGIFVFQDIEGKIYPNRKPLYSNKTGMKIGPRKYIEINFVDDEDQSYGTVYFFPQSKNNSTEKVNNVFINVHIQNKQDPGEIKTSNNSKLTDILKTTEYINTSQTEKSTIIQKMTDYEEIAVKYTHNKQGSSSSIHFNNSNFQVKPNYGEDEGATTRSYYNEDINMNISLTNTSHMDRSKQFTADYSTRKYDITDNSPLYTEINASQLDGIVSSTKHENTTDFTTKLSSEHTSGKLQYFGNSQTISITEKFTTEASLTTELRDLFNITELEFSGTNTENQRVGTNNTEVNSSTESLNVLKNTTTSLYSTPKRNVSEGVDSLNVEIISNGDKKYSRIDKDFQDFNNKLTTDGKEFKVDYTTIAEDSDTAYSDLLTIIIPNKTADKNVHTDFQTSLPNFNTTYSTYPPDITHTFSSITNVIKNTSEFGILGNSTSNVSSNNDNDIINLNSTAVSNYTISRGEVTFKSQVTSSWMEIKTNHTEYSESEDMNITNKSLITLEESQSTLYTSEGNLKSILFNTTEQPLNYDELYTELKVNVASKPSIVSFKSSHHDVPKVTSPSIEYSNHPYLKTTNLPDSIVTISTVKTDENNATESTNEVHSMQISNESVTTNISSETTPSNEKMETFGKLNMSESTIDPNSLMTDIWTLNNTDKTENEPISNFENIFIKGTTQSLVGHSITNSKSTEEHSISPSLSLNSNNSEMPQIFSWTTEMNLIQHMTDKYNSSTVVSILSNGEQLKSELKSKYPINIAGIKSTSHSENEDYSDNNHEEKGLSTTKFFEKVSTYNPFIIPTQIDNFKGVSNNEEHNLIKKKLFLSTVSAPTNELFSEAGFSPSINNSSTIEKTSEEIQTSKSLDWKIHIQNLNTEMSSVTFPSTESINDLTLNSEVPVKGTTEDIDLVSNVSPFYSLAVNKKTGDQFSTKVNIMETDGLHKAENNGKYDQFNSRVISLTSMKYNREGKALFTQNPFVTMASESQYSSKEGYKGNYSLPLNGSTRRDIQSVSSTANISQKSSHTSSTYVDFRGTEKYGTDNRNTVSIISFAFSEPNPRETSTIAYSNDSLSDNGKINEKNTNQVSSTNSREKNDQKENTVVTNQLKYATSESNTAFSTSPFSSSFSQMSQNSANHSNKDMHKENKNHDNEYTALQDSIVQYEAGFNNFTFSLPTTEHLTAYVPLRLYTIKPISEIK